MIMTAEEEEELEAEAVNRKTTVKSLCLKKTFLSPRFTSLSSFSEEKQDKTEQKNTTDAMLPASKSLRGTTLLCVLLSLALLGASVATASTGASSSGQCACSDVRPRSGGVDFELGPTCAEIRAKGDCNAGYLQKTIAEMNGAPYCQVRKKEEKKEQEREREREFRPRLSQKAQNLKKKTDHLRPVQMLPAPRRRA